jgi:hypothetical protein
VLARCRVRAVRAAQARAALSPAKEASIALCGAPLRMECRYDALGGAAPVLDVSPSCASGGRSASGGAHAAASESTAAEPSSLQQQRDMKQCAARGGAAASAGAPGAAGGAAAAPAALLGRRVLRAFADGDAVGEVVGARATHAYGVLFLVRYHDDDDEEELTWQELHAVLLPAEPAAAPPAGGAAAEGAQRGGREAAAAAAAAAASAGEAPWGDAGAAAAAAPPAAPPQERHYTGVYRGLCNGRLYVSAKHRGVHLGHFGSLEEAAAAYDASVRAQGGTVVNFPRPGAGEEQAVARTRRIGSGSARALSPPPPEPEEAPQPPPQAEAQAVAPPLRAAPAAHRVLRARDAPDYAALRASARAFKGVHCAGNAARGHCFYARVWQCGGAVVSRGPFASALDAARAHDDAARAAGKRQLNFPRPGTDETRAVRGAHEFLAKRKRARSPPPPAQQQQQPRAKAHCRDAPQLPESLLGRRVTCTFTDEDGPLQGTIVSTRTTDAFGQLWGITFDCGEGADLTWHELRAGLHPLPEEEEEEEEEEEDATSDVDDDARQQAEAEAALPPSGADAVLVLPPQEAAPRPLLPSYEAQAAALMLDAWRCAELGGAAAAPVAWHPYAAAAPAKVETAAAAVAAVPAAFAPKPESAPAVPAAAAVLAQAPPPKLEAAAAADADAAAADALTPVAAFLCAIAPPLSCLHAALAWLPGSGVSMAHLEAIASASRGASSAECLKLLLDEAATALGITRAFGRLAFMQAVLALAPPAGGV